MYMARQWGFARTVIEVDAKQVEEGGDSFNKEGSVRELIVKNLDWRTNILSSAIVDCRSFLFCYDNGFPNAYFQDECE